MKYVLVLFLISFFQALEGLATEPNLIPQGAPDCAPLVAEIDARVLELARMIIEKEKTSGQGRTALVASLEQQIDQKHESLRIALQLSKEILDERLGVAVALLEADPKLTVPMVPTTQAGVEKATVSTTTELTPEDIELAKAAISYGKEKKLAIRFAAIQAVKDDKFDIIRGFIVIFHKRDQLRKALEAPNAYCLTWNLDDPDRDNRCALHHAVDQNREAIGVALVEAGSRIPVFYSVHTPAEKIALELLKAGAEFGIEDLVAAISQKRVSVVKDIVARNPRLLAERNAKSLSALGAAADALSDEIGNFLLDSGAEFGIDDLVYAIRKDKYHSVVERMIREKPTLAGEFASGGITALIDAIRTRDGHLEDLFIQAKSDIDFQATDENAYTPLLEAIEVEDLGSVNRLIAVEVDKEKRSGKQVAPVELAIQKEASEILEALLLAGALPTPLTSGNQTYTALAVTKRSSYEATKNRYHYSDGRHQKAEEGEQRMNEIIRLLTSNGAPTQ